MKVGQRAIAVSTSMILIAIAAIALTPRNLVPEGAVALDTMVPHQFGDWVEDKTTVDQVPTEVEHRAVQNHYRPLYDQVLMRTYRRKSDGTMIMLALAYARKQVQDFKIHRPELCYYSQGFDVASIGARDVILGSQRRVLSHQLLTRNRFRSEPVTYWIRIGKYIPTGAWETRWILFKEGIEGRVPDGILVRASSLIDQDSEIQRALQAQGIFLSDLYSSLTPQARVAIAGS